MDCNVIGTFGHISLRSRSHYSTVPITFYSDNQPMLRIQNILTRIIRNLYGDSGTVSATNRTFAILREISLVLAQYLILAV